MGWKGEHHAGSCVRQGWDHTERARGWGRGDVIYTTMQWKLHVMFQYAMETTKIFIKLHVHYFHLFLSDRGSLWPFCVLNDTGLASAGRWIQKEQSGNRVSGRAVSTQVNRNLGACLRDLDCHGSRCAATGTVAQQPTWYAANA